MSRSTFSQRLMRDFKASAAKTVTLGLLLMVGLFFWVPPLLKAFSSNATAAPKSSAETTTPKPEANTSAASTAGESPVTPKNRDSKTMAKQHREQPLLQAVEADGMPRNPFCLDDELLPLPVLIAEDVSTETAAPSPKQVELPALKLDGLVLKSTLIGANRKVAMINNQLLREGQSISWNDRQLRLESIRRKSVTLTDGTQSWQLNLKDSGDDSNN